MKNGRYLISAVVLFCLAAAADAATYLDYVGLTELKTRNLLRRSGEGIRIAQVEAVDTNSNGYAPDAANAQFTGKTFTYLGVNATPTSSHATAVGGKMYGNTSGLASRATAIDIYNVQTFVYGYLQANGLELPQPMNVSVINCSWKDKSIDVTENLDILRRMDYLIDRDNTVGVVAVDNGAGSEYPVLMAAGYNSIAVGISGGQGSSKGPVKYDSGWRAKPDLVVPVSNTSEAAGVVSGAAALLLSEAAARGLPQSQLATKAILMAGAAHRSGWHRGQLTTRDDHNIPVDYAQGAGELRVSRSFYILTKGLQKAGRLVAARGWSTGTVKPTYKPWYHFELKQAVKTFTAVLTWNRRFPGEGNSFFAGRTVTNANMNLYLQKKVGSKWQTLDYSTAPSGNLETITFGRLEAGLYQLVVQSNITEKYALAWDYNSLTASNPALVSISEPALGMPKGNVQQVAVPEPGTLGLLAAVAVAGLMRRKRA